MFIISFFLALALIANPNRIVSISLENVLAQQNGSEVDNDTEVGGSELGGDTGMTESDMGGKDIGMTVSDLENDTNIVNK
ncbi:MAG TPA: hypothetical protein VFK40_10065 [Nitrososphaeraceae archaeon]|nr:hypothetical protein [Nitrososphaeraceae archaeon]